MCHRSSHVTHFDRIISAASQCFLKSFEKAAARSAGHISGPSSASRTAESSGWGTNLAGLKRPWWEDAGRPGEL